MISTLARMYTDTLGAWAMWLFLIGAIAVLGSTLWASVPSHARMYTDFLVDHRRARLEESAEPDEMDSRVHRGVADRLGRLLAAAAAAGQPIDTVVAVANRKKSHCLAVSARLPHSHCRTACPPEPRVFHGGIFQ